MKTKFKPCKNDSFNKYVSTQIAIYEKYLGIKDIVCNIIRKYDGKVVNKRIITELENAMPTFVSPRYTKEMREFYFSFRYDNALEIRFIGIANDEFINCNRNYHSEQTIYNYGTNIDNAIYGKRLNADEYLKLLDITFTKMENTIAKLVNDVENFDRVSKVYEKAYNLLKGVKDYNHLAQRAEIGTAMRKMKDVFIY